MLRSLVLTGVKPLVHIESELFGINHHNTKRFSLLTSSALIEMGHQHDCGCLLWNKTNRNKRCEKTVCSQGVTVNHASAEERDLKTLPAFFQNKQNSNSTRN